MKKLKSQVEDLSKLNQDLASSKLKFSQENSVLYQQVQTLDRANADLIKTKTQLGIELEETKTMLENETGVNIFLIVFFILENNFFTEL